MAQVSPSNQFRREYPQLSADQQSLLLAALKSRQNNKGNSYPPASAPSSNQYENGLQNESVAQFGVNPSVLNQPPVFGHSLFPDVEPVLDVDLPEGILDFTDPFTDLTGQSEADEVHEKRKSPEEDDEDDEDDEDSGPHKRQEGEDKTTKKPGRKPLTTEPTTKRKAQNRAAQRAFRERKEKHLKDLEQKVVDLEKASESANHENGLLRAQVERLHSELREYRKRLSSSGSVINRSPGSSGLSTFQERGTNITDFQFDFPKFGNLPTASFLNNPSLTSSNTQSIDSPIDSFNRNSIDYSSRHESSSLSPPGANNNANMHSPDNMLQNGVNSLSPHSQGSLADGLDGLFSPTILNGVGSGSYGFPMADSPQTIQSPSISNKATSFRQQSLSQSASNTASPSASSQSQNGPTSSCGTSPEPMHNSPATKLSNVPEERSNSAGEKTFCDKLQEACGDKSNPIPRTKSADCGCYPANKATAKTPGSDLGSFDWLASQNGGQFDPVLFGDYRESQDAIVGGSEFTGGFFEESFPDLESQFFNTAAENAIPNPDQNPESLLDKIERERSGNGKDDELVVPGDNDRTFMTCHKIWNKLQTCPKFQSGEFDIDSLCTELQTKAKCSETGVVVPKEDVEAALWKLAGVDYQNLTQEPNRQPPQSSFF